MLSFPGVLRCVGDPNLYISGAAQPSVRKKRQLPTPSLDTCVNQAIQDVSSINFAAYSTDVRGLAQSTCR